MNKQRIAFVGCGGIAEHYLHLYRDLPWVEVVTCVDVVEERARSAAAELSRAAHQKIQPRATTDFDEALGRDVETVVINSPNHLHRVQAEAALGAGKHLLLQKPIAATLADAEAIAAAATAAVERGVISGLYLSYFDQPLMYDLREMMRLGWFGQVAHLSARLMHRGGLILARQIADGKFNWRASIAQTGGGCFIQLAIHFIHLFSWMMESSVVSVSAMMKNQNCPGVEGEDVACAILEFANGALATLDTAWCAAGEQMAIHGTRGTIEYLDNQTLTLRSDAGPYTGRVLNYTDGGTRDEPGAPGAATMRQVTTLHAPRLDDLSNPYNQHRLFLEAVRDDHSAPVSIASGVEDLRVVAAVYESARTGRVVRLKSKEATEQ